MTGLLNWKLIKMQLYYFFKIVVHSLDCKVMSSFKIFIVEDDPWYGEILEYNLSMNPDYEIKRFSNGNDCPESIKPESKSDNG
jgi:hypothetical protein